MKYKQKAIAELEAEGKRGKYNLDKTAMFHMRVSEDMLISIHKAAAKKGQCLTAWVRTVIDRELDREISK